ncbi:hypothetical protein BDV93DRAFT_540562 [Ceratobasidium sp. AG-I]|nr:hypothetical protein BDV93DRAFT_540562 [Ceratobasidium sp. AG-I]
MSTQFLSAGLLLLVSAAISLVALAPILIYANLRGRAGSISPLGGILLFPTLWMTTWSVFVWVSPLGRIGSWSPMTGIEAYSWITPVFGQAGIDYVTALWAAILAEYSGQWLMGPKVHEQLPENASPNVDFLTPIEGETEPQVNGTNARRTPSGQYRNPAHYLLGLLLLASLPSYQTPILPLSPHSEHATELTVGCIHPAVKTAGTPPSLGDYVAETRSQGARAKILLWPEGAVKFQSDEERRKAFNAVSLVAYQYKIWIGVGYEQEYSENGGTVRGKRVRGHNGLAILGPNTTTINYVKRKLVPLVESFSFESSIDPPPKYPVHLPKPNSRPKSEKDTWPRTIPVTAAICLDVSAPLATSVPVNATEEDVGRPALILVPARTWHHDIGKAMFAHASMRALEQGASVLWCDGGEGGVSGVGGLAAQGLGPVGGIGQVGAGGSWLQTIGIPYPYEAKGFAPTWYAHLGDLGVILLAWGLLGAGFAVPFASNFANILSAGVHKLDSFRRRTNEPVQRNESTPLLVDA